MSAISSELAEKTNFHVAVPGTYIPGRKPITIEYFVGKFTVYNSKQAPKDVIIKGNDGNFYQYLLKGHEDLRLDERIMQFFGSVNSFILKETCFNGNIIQTTSVIPLSNAHGLVQWIPGTETLRNIFETVRNLHKIEPLIEYTLAEKYSHGIYDNLMPIQKMQILEKIFYEIPDNVISNFFWLKSPDSKTWLKQINTFSITSAMTSILGYVIGLGDRHPSNLLINSITGKVIHIDFGDCFEKAANRKRFPETVPFRLTRNMVKALGPGGVDGIFRSSFINMSNILRDNYRVLVMILAIFVQEPLVDSDDCVEDNMANDYKMISLHDSESYLGDIACESSVLSSVEMTRRVKAKLTGTDFGTKDKPFSVEEQADKLISMATDTYLLSKMYSGWCPFW
ncbi:PIKK family atypical protein kinase [Histomonas meleagridis]|uniref:PIKK family atypical protein kinase n=1 Tax=Histomonas meleagridis TaxID=135588 RepID=UPI00355A3D23|nr:PIKK family atypical protein kinase [Histomonas meleagridis]KAH0804273.1 PIKK family atypical protein kinase [Histomonas meleagridis]